MTLTIESPDELTRIFQTLGMTVGPRRGPHRRTKDDKEWYCLRTYLLALLSQELVVYPFKINKSEAPDFIISNETRGFFGIEVTEATEEDWQRELTETETGKDDDPAEGSLISEDGFAGDQPEIDWCGAVVRAIEKKIESLNNHTYHVDTCDLLVYVNSRMSCVVETEKAIQMLISAVEPKVGGWKACGRFGGVSVLANHYLVHDLASSVHIIEISEPNHG